MEHKHETIITGPGAHIWKYRGVIYKVDRFGHDVDEFSNPVIQCYRLHGGGVCAEHTADIQWHCCIVFPDLLNCSNLKLGMEKAVALGKSFIELQYQLILLAKILGVFDLLLELDCLQALCAQHEEWHWRSIFHHVPDPFRNLEIKAFVNLWPNIVQAMQEGY